MHIAEAQVIGQRLAEIFGLPLTRIIEKYNIEGFNPGACDYRRGEVRLKLSGTGYMQPGNWQGSDQNDVYLLAHEMSHLIHADHEPDFHRLTSAIEKMAWELREEYRDDKQDIPERHDYLQPTR